MVTVWSSIAETKQKKMPNHKWWFGEFVYIQWTRSTQKCMFALMSSHKKDNQWFIISDTLISILSNLSLKLILVLGSVLLLSEIHKTIPITNSNDLEGGDFCWESIFMWSFMALLCIPKIWECVFYSSWSKNWCLHLWILTKYFSSFFRNQANDKSKSKC